MASAIEFENISKQYRLGVVSTGTLSHDLNRFWHTKVLRREDPYLKIGETNDRSHQGKSEYVWALKNIDFKVEQGDVVGIIGKNGAGKSTLLKLLSRVTAPTTGIIRARGRIASLLEVGTGFHPEMTGRENIYMNGAIMGMTRSEITRKLDEIVDFSGCERYLDTPVKRYSSGMIVRLGFAIAAHLEPEILVVDEVLAVGDAEFQKKAIGKMQDVSQGEGRTVLFVSHNMGAVKNLCKRGVLLEQGKVKRIGPVNDVVDEYINQNQGIFEFTKYKDRSGNGTIIINSVEYFNSNNEKINTLKTGEEVIICVNYEIIQNMDHVMESYIDIGFNNLNGSRVAWISSRIFQKKLDPNLKSIKFKIPHLMLDQGSYTINIHCETNIARADWLKNVGNFDVVFDNYFGTNKTIPNNQGSVVLDFQLIK
jgi:lipopolysaccharide transport system ATP-binding protein